MKIRIHSAYVRGQNSSCLFHVSCCAAAFTLLEVIIACAIFFMAVFAILGVVTQGVSAARAMQVKEPDIGMIASCLSTSNRLEEGSMGGDFEAWYPGVYPGYSWQADILEIGSNGYFRIDISISGGKKGASDARSWIEVFAPNSPPGSASKGAL